LNGSCVWIYWLSHEEEIFLNLELLRVLFWWLGGRATPDPIPNTEVKSPSADDPVKKIKSYGVSSFEH
jgi:hypothetical protein